MPHSRRRINIFTVFIPVALMHRWREKWNQIQQRLIWWSRIGCLHFKENKQSSWFQKVTKCFPKRCYSLQHMKIKEKHTTTSACNQKTIRPTTRIRSTTAFLLIVNAHTNHEGKSLSVGRSCFRKWEANGGHYLPQVAYLSLTQSRAIQFDKGLLSCCIHVLLLWKCKETVSYQSRSGISVFEVRAMQERYQILSELLRKKKQERLHTFMNPPNS